MIERLSGGPTGSTGARRPPAAGAPGIRHGWGERGARRPGRPVRAVPGPARHHARGPGAPRRLVARRRRLAGGPRSALAEPRDDGRQPGRDGDARACRWRSSWPAGRSAARAGWRPSSTCRSSCRRPSRAWPCCSYSVGAGCCRRPSSSSGSPSRSRSFAVIIAQTFVSAPFFIRSARTGIAGVDRDLEDAARVDGASERQLFRSITVPLAGAALAAGLVMSWARSLGEFGATIMFAGNIEGRTQTLPLGRLQRVPGRRPRCVDRRGRDPGPGRIRRARRGAVHALGPGARRPRRGMKRGA